MLLFLTGSKNLSTKKNESNWQSNTCFHWFLPGCTTHTSVVNLLVIEKENVHSKLWRLKNVTVSGQSYT